MKKFLKKLGVIGLIVAVLSPFLTLPNVNAETNCKKYLNQYLFLDASSIGAWSLYSNKGYTTYTSYLYNIPAPAENEIITIENVGEYPITTEEQLLTYYGIVEQMKNDTTEKVNIELDGKILEQNFTSGKYETITALLHGKWSQEDGSTKPSGWDLESDFNSFRNKTIQYKLLDNKYSGINLKINVGGAVYNSSQNRFYPAGNYTTNLIDFYQKIVNDINGNKADSYNSQYIYKDNENNTYLNFTITRKMEGTDLDNFKFGGKHLVKNSEGKWVEGTDYFAWSTDPVEVKESYTALNNYISNEDTHSLPENKGSDGNWCAESTGLKCYKVNTDGANVNFNVSEVLYWPAVYNIAYSVCQKEANPVEKWTLKYHPNSTESDYTNMPKDEKDLTTNTVVVSSTEPTRTNYKFVGWNTKADRSGTNYKTKDNVEKPKDTNEITLYAQWDKLGPEDPKKQGVLSYVLGFAAVGLVAGGIYLVSKKKNLFKQI